MLYAEYGARVKLIDERYARGLRGTIVSDPIAGLVIVDIDGIGIDVFAYTRVIVTQTPSETAHSLTTRWSVDECLERIGRIVAIDGRNTPRDRYTAALIFELYRLNYHAEQVVQHAMSEEIAPFFENVAPFFVVDTERSEVRFYHVDPDNTDDEPDRERADGYDPELDGGWESGACDDGYGYPVYRDDV